ncbi:MAG: flagellar biosynthesis anti-sigma factor FlgM [Spirochaetales bacterium]|nr:flagellar biosynthesis anti-sigma factor FlgM [Spirochaetales bacterium]
MTIKGLGPVDPLNKINKTPKTSKTTPSEKTDSVDVSQEARNLGEMYKVAEQVKMATDIRLDRIEEIKEKLKDPNYMNDRVIESVADSILESFGIS